MGYKIVRALLNFIFFGLFRLHVEGRENVPSTGAVIVAPNHKSDWDPPLIGVAFITKIFHHKISGHCLLVHAADLRCIQ